MKGLTADERLVLELSLTEADDNIELGDHQCDVADELTKRGLMMTWFDEEGATVYRANAVGRLLLAVTCEVAQ